MTIDTARWSRLQNLFNEAVELPMAQRDAFLTESCGDDAELRQELEDMLAADREPSLSESSGVHASIFTQAMSLSLDKLHDERRAAWIGEMIGPYRLTQVLGHGGASTVYLGERVDQQYSGQVAIKLFEQTFHEKAARNFQAERQILANLNHPQIAKLFDAGKTDDGHPYLVMEYVQGEPIDHYCDSRQLSLADRIALFLKVCAVVQYAHQNLVVHRDLKPGNILVTNTGEPKLLDFGIAKLLDQSNAPTPTQPLTQLHERILTPEYASPEQFRGQNITTASDVYALGIVLYEMLTSTRPYDVNVVSQLDLERVICITDPPTPSQRMEQIRAGRLPGVEIDSISQARSLSAKRLSRELRGDLDAIVMRALRKEAGKRYFSVEQLADDLERYVKHEPVLARQGNWVYYSKRFVSRHWIGVGISAFIILVLGISSIALSIQNQRIVVQRDLARQENRRAESVSNFMLDVFSSTDPFETYGKQVTAKELLDQAGDRIKSDKTMEPAVRAQLMAAIGKAYQRQAQPELAMGYLEESLRIMRGLPNVPAEIFARNSEQLAIVQYLTSQFTSTEKTLLDGIKALENGNKTDTTIYPLLMAYLSILYVDAGYFAKADIYFNKAMARVSQLPEKNNKEAADTLSILGGAKYLRGEISQALALAREAESIDSKIFPEGHPARELLRFKLAQLLLYQGRTAEAATRLKGMLQTQEKLYGEYNIQTARTLDALSDLNQQEKNWQEAEALSRRALKIVMQVYGSDAEATRTYQTALADVLIKTHQNKEADQLIHSALTITSKSELQDVFYLNWTQYLQARLYAQTGREKTAIQVLQAQLAKMQQKDTATWRIARSQNLLAALTWQQSHDAASKQQLLDSWRVLSDPKTQARANDIAEARVRTEAIVGKLD